MYFPLAVASMTIKITRQRGAFCALSSDSSYITKELELQKSQSMDTAVVYGNIPAQNKDFHGVQLFERMLEYTKVCIVLPTAVA